MNMGSLVQMVTRAVIRQLVRRGVNAGLGVASKQMKRKPTSAPAAASSRDDPAAKARQTARSVRSMRR